MRCLRRRRSIPLKISKQFKFVVVTTVAVYLGLIFVVLLKSSALNEYEQSNFESGKEKTTPETADDSLFTGLDHEKANETQDTTLHGQGHYSLSAETLPIPVVKQPNKCKVAQHHNFPLCNAKFQFIKRVWTLPCFREMHGVTENDCSALQYLSEVEHFCPTLPHREHLHKSKDRGKLGEKSIRLEPKDLEKTLSEPSLSWLRLRIGQMWPGWREAGEQLLLQPYIRERAKKKVLFFLGSMSFQPWLLRWAGHGGPLGELIQWTDVIAASYLLGHEINVVLNGSHLRQYLPSADSKGCIPAVVEESKDYDLIFTDLNGMTILGRILGSSAQSMLRCKLRVLDSFGTQAEFNQHGYPGKLLGGRSGWGNKDLVLGQFMTLFPHSPDNSFLGFVAGGKSKIRNIKRKNRALIYGKLSSYVEGFKGYLDIVHEYFEIHATAVRTSSSLPDYVINHGSVTGKEIADLLRQSKVFIGLGFPYEGPGPLEAAFHGTVFINPKFAVPRNKLNDKFFEGKPTLRKLTSQSPYMEKFVGEPHVYTIDVKDTARVRQVMEEISKREVFEPYLPKEFTHFGFAERVLGYIQHQDFCYSTKPQWPPLKNRQIFLSFAGESCSDHCMRKGLVCEGTYFLSINRKEVFDSVGVQCPKTKTSVLTHAPSYDVMEDVCYLQAHGLSFSCDTTMAHYRRLCPCRNYEIEQVAICGGCLS